MTFLCSFNGFEKMRERRILSMFSIFGNIPAVWLLWLTDCLQTHSPTIVIHSYQGTADKITKLFHHILYKMSEKRG